MKQNANTRDENNETRLVIGEATVMIAGKDVTLPIVDPSKIDILSDIIKAHTGFNLYPTIEEQEQYWKERNADLDRIESCTTWFDEKDSASF